MFKFENQPTYPLSVLGNDLVDSTVDTSAYYTDRYKSKVDYRVYWYGEVDVWLDYVRLDDEWAHFLFTNVDVNNPVAPGNIYKFHRRIKEEVENLSYQSGFGYFYFDEFYYNSVPCVKKVMELIKNYNPNSGIIVISPPAAGLAAGIKNELTLQEIYDYENSQGLFTDFVATDNYPFYDDTPVPSNLTLPDPSTYPGTIRYNRASSLDAYDNNLNLSIFNFRNLYQVNANVIKTNPNTIFIATVQAHSLESNFRFFDCNVIPNFELKREPTNEEISLQAYYALVYGAKQIHYYTHFSGRVQRENPNCPDYFYDWGMTGFVTSGQQPKREYNYYGQQKWNYVRKLDSNMMKIGNYMYSTNELKYDNTISVYQDGLSYGVINNLKSYYRNSVNDTVFTEEDQNKYWEIGYFKDNNNLIDKYFLLVNKRCVPEINGGEGDLRKVKLYFDTSQIQHFNNWILSNPITNEKIVFDKHNITNGLQISDTFLPGEGKLFKLAPVFEEGGTFVGEEEVESISFNCKGNVYNGGYNITLNPGVSISIFSGTSINMEGVLFVVTRSIKV